MTALTVTADRTRCIGAGRCALTAPAVFTADDDGLVVVRAGHVPERDRSDVETAVSLCPAGALRTTPHETAPPGPDPATSPPPGA